MTWNFIEKPWGRKIELILSNAIERNITADNVNKNFTTISWDFYNMATFLQVNPILIKLQSGDK